MMQDFTTENWTDSDGNPDGGYAKGVGMDITWQQGALGRGTDRLEPNGAFVETVIKAAKTRIEFYQLSRFSCRENAIAITKLDEALHWLNHRTSRRECDCTEGTHEK